MTTQTYHILSSINSDKIRPDKNLVKSQQDMLPYLVNVFYYYRSIKTHRRINDSSIVCLSVKRRN